VPVLDATALEKSYAARSLLHGVDLTLRRGERVGLVGLNGCGKSTLARILAGVEPPDEGRIALRRGASVAYLPQEPRLPAGQTVRQIVLESLAEWSQARERHDELTAVLAGGDAGAELDVDALSAGQAAAAEAIERLGGWERRHEADGIIHDLGIADPGRLSDTLSGGERRRVALAQVLVREPDLAVLDEPTNHLDVATIEWLEEYLATRFRGAVLLVTHDRAVLDRVTTRTLELEDGVLTSYDGGYATYLEARAERRAQEQRTERNRQNFLRREVEWLRRQPKARGTKQKARIRRAGEALDKSAPREERTAQLKLAAERQGKTILELDGVVLERGGQRLVDGLEMRLGAGQRVGVVGPNGVGKTSLLLAILGELAPVAGEIRRGTTTRIATLDQERSGLDPALTVRESLGERGEVASGGDVLEVAAYLERFLFDRPAQRVRVGELSGGERARVCLAKLLAERANLLLLDEPTNDLDTSTLAALEAMLLDFAGSAIVVSHDRWFLDRVATGILAFEGDGRVVLHAGNYSEYRERVGRSAPGEVASGASAVRRKRGVKVPPASPTARKLSYKEQRELEGLLDVIGAAEDEVTRFEAELASPETYQREAGSDRGQEAARISELSATLEAARARVAKLTARWEELEERREAAGRG
jgi:ATP-binding cassette subfamily F protein uup